MLCKKKTPYAYILLISQSKWRQNDEWTKSDIHFGYSAVNLLLLLFLGFSTVKCCFCDSVIVCWCECMALLSDTFEAKTLVSNCSSIWCVCVCVYVVVNFCVLDLFYQRMQINNWVVARKWSVHLKWLEQFGWERARGRERKDNDEKWNWGKMLAEMFVIVSFDMFHCHTNLLKEV